METDHRKQNPYAAPVSTGVSTEVATDTVAPHQDFIRVGNKLRCRSGLQLPPYCLVTGAAENLVPLPLSLWAPGKSLRRYRFGGIGLMLAVPIVVALAFLLGASPPAVDEDGVFELRGFSKAFLKRLGESSDAR